MLRSEKARSSKETMKRYSPCLLTKTGPRSLSAPSTKQQVRPDVGQRQPWDVMEWYSSSSRRGRQKVGSEMHALVAMYGCSASLSYHAEETCGVHALSQSESPFSCIPLL